MYAAREDRNISVRGGGKISYDNATGNVTFTEDIVLHDHVTDKTVTITTAASPTNLSSSNRIGYVVKNREPASNQSITSITTAAAGALPDAVGDNGNIVIFHRTSDGTLLIPWLRRELLSGDFFVPRTGYSFYEWKAAHGRPGYKSITADSSQLIVTASSSKPAVVKIDGKIYANVSDKTLDLDTAGRNGLDTGTKAASTVYYLYAIPPTSGFTFDVVCSVNDPDTGPSGFSAYSYLGGFITGTSSAIIEFVASDGLVMLSINITADVNFNSSTPTLKTFLIPVTAICLYARSTWAAVNAITDTLTCGASTTSGQGRHRATSTTVNNNGFAYWWCPILTPQQISGDVTTSTTDSINVKVMGWQEKILEYK
jgi:hypothetical protein